MIADQDETGLAQNAALIAGPVLARVLDVRDRQGQMALAADVAGWAPAPLGMVFHVDPMQRDLSHEAAVAQFESLAQTTPERAAEIIHHGVSAGKSRILVGPDARLFDALVRIAPTRCYDVLARLEPLAVRRRA